MKQWNIPPILLAIAGAVVTLVVTFVAARPAGAAQIGLCIGAFLPLAGIPFLRSDENTDATELDTAKQQFASEQAAFEKERSGIEDWRDTIRRELDEQVNRIEAKERSLSERLAVHQELFEYPKPAIEPIAFEDNQTLTEQDQQVLELLQKEAEAAYEKIRNKEYSKDGKADIQLIRDDVFQLVTRVAKIYAPDSDNPLLETSFEQVARAAGRVCLHALVLVEQLPLDVKQYNFNSMYSYIQKAVVAYGRYQSSAPWLTYLSRTVYAGRFMAGANPLTLGAWVVATEVGKRAGQKAVESFVDRQAIGLLHDLIRVVGFEVANIYGGDFRHRDPNWVYGSELTELMGRFPLSRESLKEGLQQVSALPLRNEYDRIYLYRCVADHRAAGLTLADPALLTRDEREKIAAQLEKFFNTFVHGATDKDVEKWRTDFEERFDMKLKIDNAVQTSTATDHAPDCVRSIRAFLTNVVGLNDAQTEKRLAMSSLFNSLTNAARSELLATPANQFEPPDLDPSDPAVDPFLDDLIKTAVSASSYDDNVERLLTETGAYFRRTVPEMREKIDATYITRATQGFAENAPTKKIPASLARIIAAHNGTGQVAFAYTDIGYATDDKPTNIDNAWLVGLTEASATKLLLFQPDKNADAVWTATAPLASRDKGFLIDDCRLSGGEWKSNDFPNTAAVVAVGTIRGGGYARWFAPLLAVCKTDDASAS